MNHKSLCSRRTAEGVVQVDAGVDHVDAKPRSDVFQYNMNYRSVGQCVVINNKNFHRKTGN